MERFEGRCRLEWWANSRTLLGSEDADVVITPSGAGWNAYGRLVTDDDQARDGFLSLCRLDPVAALRFPDESTVAVTVHPAVGRGRFTLTEYTGGAGQ